MARPFDGGQILEQPAGVMRLANDTALRWATRGVDALGLSWLALIVAVRARTAWRDTRIGRLLWLGALIEALLFSLIHADRATMLSGGNDWLTYEYFARTIALGDPLLREPGFGGGQGGPFCYQPLYPYVVALTHLRFGDSLFGVVLAQRLLLFATIGWIAALTERLFGGPAGWIALLCGGAFLYVKGGPWTEVPVSSDDFHQHRVV